MVAGRPTEFCGNSSEALGTGPISINGNDLRLNNVTLDEAITVDANTGGGGITGLGASNVLNGAVALNSGLDVRGNNITWSGGVTSTANQGMGINGAKHVFDTVPINLGTGGFGLTSAGNSEPNATLLNVGSNVWGQTTINFGGYLKLGGSDYMPTNTNVRFGWHVQGSSSGTLNLNGYDQTVASIAIVPQYPGLGGDQTITGGGTLTVNLASGSQEYQGRITDGSTPTALTKNGGGTQILNNLSGTPSDYSGATTVDGGALQLGGGTPVGNNTPVTVASGATLRLDGYSIAIGSLGGAGTVENVGVVEALLDDDFSSGSVGNGGGRFREYHIGEGWYSRSDSEWVVTNGIMQNAATTFGTHYDACPAESSLVQVRRNTLGGPVIQLSFDYGVPAGDILYVHFWGYTNACDLDSDIMANLDTCDGNYANYESLTELDAFNLKDGATTFNGGPNTALTNLTGSGSYSNTIMVADLGFDSVSDFSYISLAFGQEEDGFVGTTWVDNVSIRTDETVLTVGGDDTATTFSGLLQEGIGGGVLGLMKTGANVVTLAGTNAYTGSTTVNGGTLVLGGSVTSATNAALGVFGGSTFKVSGSGASISVVAFESDDAAGNTLAFELDADGVGPLNVLGGSCALADLALTVNGADYAGIATAIVLVDAAELQSISTNVTVTGFARDRYFASLVQDQDADEVRLMIKSAATTLVVR